MKIDIITLFPKMFKGPFDESIIMRAQNKNLVEITIHNLRKWTKDKRGTVDDRPYGGGVGMVMMTAPIAKAIEKIKSQNTKYKNLSRACRRIQNTKIVLLSPRGKVWKQEMCQEYSKLDHLILICGHYEGVDERVREFIDEEISIGDFVLTGGEYPSMVIVDAVSRLVPGFVGNSDSVLYDSFTMGLLEGPHYTRPREYKGWKVPEVLLSGHQKKIEKWRRIKSLVRTVKRRPDLLEKVDLTEEDRNIIEASRSKLREISDG